MTEVANIDDDRPMNMDEQLVSLHRLLGQLLREEKTLRDMLETLDEQDAQSFDVDSDDPELAQRQRERLGTDAALKQVLNRIRGAKDALATREREVVEGHVEKVRLQIHADLDAMNTEALEANDAINQAIAAVRRIQIRGRELVQRYRGVRGRSMLTSEGHIAGGSLTSMQDPGNYRFAIESHFASYMPGWHTESGATGEFAARIGGQISSLRSSLDMLLSQEAFYEAVAAETLAKANQSEK